MKALCEARVTTRLQESPHHDEPWIDYRTDISRVKIPDDLDVLTQPKDRRIKISQAIDEPLGCLRDMRIKFGQNPEHHGRAEKVGNKADSDNPRPPGTAFCAVLVMAHGIQNLSFH